MTATTTTSTTTADIDPPADPGRLRDLASALSALRTRAASGGLQLERRLAVAGGVLMPLGVVLVLLAWYGASHTSRVYLQIPYLISGGLLGVVVAVTGGFLYFAHWLTRIVGEQRTQAEEAASIAREAAATLARIEVLLGDLGTARVQEAAPSRPARAPRRAAAERASTTTREPRP